MPPSAPSKSVPLHPSSDIRHPTPDIRPPSSVLVFGSRGMLGSEVVEGLVAAGFEVDAPLRPAVDICDPESLRPAFAKAGPPSLVINCAAYTAVDRAESEQQKCFAINRDGPANLADECRAAGAPLIHISTDYVFDGKARRPYEEDDPHGPINAYGRSKWEGEEAVRSRLAEHVIIRTAWLYGARGANFVKTILRLAGEREELRIVDDQSGCPTWTRDLAGCIVRIAARTLDGRDEVKWGTYHFCGAGVTTWYDFARAIVEWARRKESLKVKDIKPIPTTSYPVPAERPAWSVLDCRKIGKEFGISPSAWEESLALMLEELWQIEARSASSGR